MHIKDAYRCEFLGNFIDSITMKCQTGPNRSANSIERPMVNEPTSELGLAGRNMPPPLPPIMR